MMHLISLRSIWYVDVCVDVEVLVCRTCVLGATGVGSNCEYACVRVWLEMESRNKTKWMGVDERSFSWAICVSDFGMGGWS